MKIYLDYTDKELNDIVIDVTYEFYLGDEGDYDTQSIPDWIEVTSVLNCNTRKEIIQDMTFDELDYIEDEVMNKIQD